MSSDETEASIIEAGELASTEDKMRRALGLDGGSSGRPNGDKGGSRMGDRTLQLSNGSMSSGHVPSGGPTERRKHRFVQDGEIQYTVERRRSWTPGGGSAAPGGPALRTNGGSSGPETSTVNPLEGLQAALRTEQATKERMERLLREAQSKIHDLQTTIGHATLARSEAQQAFEAAKARIAELEEAAADHQEQLVAAHSARDAAVRARKELADQLAEEREARQIAEKAIQDAVATRLTVDAVRDVVTKPRKAAATPAKPRTKVKEPQPVKWWIKSKPTAKKS